MLKWLTDAVRDVRIALDRRGFERDRRASHLAHAARRFDVRPHEKRIAELIAPYEAEADERFGARIAELYSDIAVMDTTLAECSEQLALLKRDFGAELAPLIESARDLKGDIGDTIQRRRSLSDELDSVRSDIEWWHRKANCYLLYRNQHLPKSRWFGMDQNDLEHLKSRRDELKDDRDRLHRRIMVLKASQATISEEIDAIKVDRDRAKALRDAGHRVGTISHAIAVGRKAIGAKTKLITELEARRQSFLDDAYDATGASRLQSQVRRMRREYEAFIAAFDLPEAREARADEHRALWLASRKKDAA